MAENNYLNQAIFEVKIDNVKADGFIRVMGMGVECEDIPAKDETGKSTVNNAGSVNARDITLVRRFTGDKSLHEWMAEVKKQGNKAPRTGSIRMMNSERKQVAQFDFEGAWIKAWYPPDLTKEAGANSNLVETVVLSVSDLKMV